MNKTIGKLMKTSSGFARALHVGATDLRSGHLMIFTDSMSANALQTGIYASASQYLEMPIVKFKDTLLVEGSIRYTADVLGVVNYCLDKGYKEKDIIVDTIFTEYSELKEVDAKKFRTLDVVHRVYSIYNFQSINFSMEVAYHTFPSVHFRHIIRPSEDLVGIVEGKSYNYNKHQLKQLYKQGLEDAADTVHGKRFK
mmetsp:Transcript_17985/g.32309  ORF Transcript_17985/g.32309 Transcript_17985/m.32309 type:complete len:197 (+) Transcript_17985:456-1046(+)